MKKLLVATWSVLFVLTACQKEALVVENENQELSSVKTVARFYASTEAGAATKVILEKQEDDSFSAVWDGGESICVSNGEQNTLYQLSEEGESSLFRSFVPNEEPLEETGHYVACSPWNLPLRDDKVFHAGIAFFPSEQTCLPDVPFFDAPMIAVSDNQNLSFRHLAGFVRLNLKAAEGFEGVPVKSITLSSGKQLSGPFAFDASSGNSLTAAESLSGAKDRFPDDFEDSGSVILQIVPEGPEIEEGDGAEAGESSYPVLSTAESKSFFICVPPGEYDSFVITVNGVQGIMQREVSKTFTAKNTIRVERAKITDINLTVKFPTQAYLPDGIQFSAGKEFSWDKIAGGEDNASNKIRKIVFETNSTVSSGMILWQALHGLSSDCHVYANFDSATGTATISTAADVMKVYNANGLFARLNNLETIEGIKHLDTEEVTDMEAMFFRCYHLVSLDLRSFSVENVKTFNTMFSDCEALTSLDLSTWKTSSLVNTYQMFGGCWNVTSLNLGPDFTLSSECYKMGMCNSLGESQSNCTITCSASTKEALLETDPANDKFAITRLGNEGHVTFTWKIVD
ncbi:MAG: BspA family leucine-rich repeat surface protein [Bacteroidales bacterium]|nr:BspA family leucine-rich repeat surface protein [Bacteroidales bacterium]